MASVSNLAIDQGTTYETTILVNDDTGSARNLVGYTVRGQLRRSYYSSNSVTWTAQINSPVDGEITISLTAAQTANLKAGRYVYDVELISNSTAAVERIIEGIITVYPEVTK